MFEGTYLENDNAEHDEKADADDDGEWQEVRVNVERFIVSLKFFFSKSFFSSD